MSSSEHLHHPELPDLRQGTPPVRARQFVEQREFERVERRPVREISAEEAYAHGQTEGEQRGREAAARELLPAIAELQRVAASLTRVREQRLAELEDEIVDVATNVVRHVLRGELRQDSDTVLHMARACLSEAADQGELIVHVSPSDLELMRAHVPELEVDLGEARLALRADASLAPGGVVLETPHHVFDGRPERVLDAALRDETPGNGGQR